MQKTVIFYIGLSLATLTSSFAQINFGPKLGLNASSVHEDFTVSAEETNPKTRIGLNAGLMMNAQIGEYFAIRPELLYSQSGYKVSAENSSVTYTYGYLTLPLNLVGQYPINEDVKLQAFAGPYAALFINGAQKIDSSGAGYSSMTSNHVFSTKEPYYSYGPDNYINPWDFGLSLGAGVQVHQFVFSAAYKLGFMNIAGYTVDGDDTYRDNHKRYNRGFTFGIAYLIRGKTH